MRLFTCQNCAQLLHFENDHCERCHKSLGYLPRSETLSVIEPDGDGYIAMAEPKEIYRSCANAEHHACNWMVRSVQESPFCLACRHNRTVPDLSISDNIVRWQKIELAKHRLFYTLIQLGLPLRDRNEDPEFGLAFDFLSDEGAATVLTGHDQGLITLKLAEADDGVREQVRQKMGEPYRTLLGHLRHEVGHYYWDELVDRGDRLSAYRAAFGDERIDYQQALASYYENGAPSDWQENFVSAYASAHPWEDFAETWAHYLHIVDTLEMASSFGLKLNPKIEANARPEVDLDESDLSICGDITNLVDRWFPVTIAVNSINRCMGQPDLYPFVLAPAVITKLGFVHDLIRGTVPIETLADKA